MKIPCKTKYYGISCDIPGCCAPVDASRVNECPGCRLCDAAKPETERLAALDIEWDDYKYWLTKDELQKALELLKCR